MNGTQIFARSMPEGRQILVYGMNVAAKEPVAMILPIPVLPGAPDDAVRFIDLQGYPKFLHDLDAAFPPEEIPAGRGGGLRLQLAPESRPLLRVHEVGDFVASFVPSTADFERLDPRFRLSDAIWDALPQYGDYGFAVFQLHDLGSRGGLLGKLTRRIQTKTIHPMAFEFPRRDPQAVFFPTIHVHDGQVHAKALFDHHLYVQPGPDERLDLRSPLEWRPNDTPLSHHLDGERTAGIVDLEANAFTMSKIGTLDNADTVVKLQ
ncbi:MAG: hypothetical protein K0V04_03545 [Deltaproteobacteria bacterium]|nr:hypothetical protein [Deltaproteobacteria bacterium]